MKNKTNLKKGLRTASLYNQIFNKLAIITLMTTGIETSLKAQVAPVEPATTTTTAPQFTKPSWWFGAAAGANFNYYDGSTQKLNGDLTIPVPFHNGNGVGLFVGPLIEYHRANSRWGIMLQGGYDSRKGQFNDVISPCNCPNQLTTKLSYITIEPSLRFAPFKSGFYLYAGPRLGFIMEKSFNYRLVKSSPTSEQPQNPDIKGDFSDINTMLLSMQVGMGYDIPVTKKSKQNQFVISPFVSFQPYFGQSPRSIETWNVTTLRGGAAFKLGHGHKIPTDTTRFYAIAKTNTVAIVPIPDVQFSVYAPKNIPVDRRVRETFPLRNYVFFNIGSTEIPSRYVLIKKDQVKEFKETELEVFKPKKLSGRSDRQMVAYYNILNILGDRMGKKPTTTVKLVGSSEQGPENGKVMAESVKKYLVDVFGIEPSRIATEGRVKPEVPSEKPGGTKDLDLFSESNRRVSIETISPTLLMEFQSGPDAPLLPVEIVGVQEAPIDSYVTFNVDGATDAYKSWSIEATDEKGNIQNFGPYTQNKMSLPGKTILGTRPEGDYKIKMIGTTKDGKTVTKETSVHMVLWTPPKNEEGIRYSVLFDYNISKAANVYEKYLSDVVTPKIPANATVIIHGYTDITGEEAYNHKLSIARANDVSDLLKASLAKAGRTDVKFQVYGFGADPKLAQFENKFPEERVYNRSVVIDIIPQN